MNVSSRLCTAEVRGSTHLGSTLGLWPLLLEGFSLLRARRRAKVPSRLRGEREADDYEAARKTEVFARDLVAAMEREASRRPSIDGRDGNGRAALMAYSRGESFLYFEFPSDVYEQVSKEFKTELEYRRAMRAFEERL